METFTTHPNMKKTDKKPAKELYEQLRVLTCEQLWENEVARFDKATPKERSERVGLIRAVGVVFSEIGNPEQKARVRPWLRNLLNDPDEKIRRYAMTAMPKLGAGQGEETDLLALLRTTQNQREKKFLGQALEKIGGTATLEEMGGMGGGFSLQTEQKVKASLARSQTPSSIRMDRALTDFVGLRIHLHGRYGLEQIVRSEVEEHVRAKGQFRMSEVRSGLVVLIPVKAFTLADIYALRCFGTLGFVLGAVNVGDEAGAIEALAKIITSIPSWKLLKTFTDGPVRYRLDFISKGHQRGAVRLLANRAYEMCPELLNDASEAPWCISIETTDQGETVELRPKLSPDPRFAYRQKDVPAASHPPLAACMARLAGSMENEIVWDPFCGSGLELIEKAMLGGVCEMYATDRSQEALDIAKANFEAAPVLSIVPSFTCLDFRDFIKVKGLGHNTASLIITNPPMGRRVAVADLRRLIEDLFSVANAVLRPGGRLVFANPLQLMSQHASLRMHSRQVVDFAGFDARLEVYVKSELPVPQKRPKRA